MIKITKNETAIKSAISAFLIFIIFFLICNREEIQQEIISALSSTFTGVIPTLFPFMVISRLFMLWGCAEINWSFLGRIFEKIFRVPKAALGPFFIGLTSSYPLGGIAVCDLYKSGKYDKESAERMLALCNNTGPGFIIGFVGSVLWKNISFGIAIYVIHVLSIFVVGIIRSRKISYIQNFNPLHHDTETHKISFAAIAEAIAASAEAVVRLAGFISFFSVFSGYIGSKLTNLPQVSAAIAAILEFSGGCISAFGAGGVIGAAITGFAISFGGLSVISQTMLAARSVDLSVTECVKMKLSEGMLSAVFSAVYVKIFRPETKTLYAVWAVKADIEKFALTVTISVLFLCLIYKIFGNTRRKNFSTKHSS